MSLLGNPFPVFHLPPAVVPSFALPTNTGPAALASSDPFKTVCGNQVLARSGLNCQGFDWTCP